MLWHFASDHACVLDESAFKMFAVYCSLALHYSKVHVLMFSVYLSLALHYSQVLLSMTKETITLW